MTSDRIIGTLSLWLAFGLVVMPVTAKETADLSFPVTPVREIYREIAALWELDIQFDAKLRHDRLSIELNGVTALEALDEVAHAAGHLIAVRDGGVLVVAADSPLNRRKYTKIQIVTLAPKYLTINDFERALRSLIEVRRASIEPGLEVLTLRDSRSRILIARQIMENLDHPPTEIDLEMRVVRSPSELLADAPARLSADEIGRLLREPETSVLAASGMTVVGSERAAITINAPVGLSGMFDLRVSGTHHHGTEEVTLDLEFEWIGPVETGRSGTGRRIHKAMQSVRLNKGETVVLGLPTSEVEERMAVLLGAKLIRPTTFDPGAVEPILVDTGLRTAFEPNRLADALAGAKVQKDPAPIKAPEPQESVSVVPVRCVTPSQPPSAKVATTPTPDDP